MKRQQRFFCFFLLATAIAATAAVDTSTSNDQTTHNATRGVKLPSILSHEMRLVNIAGGAKVTTSSQEDESIICQHNKCAGWHVVS